MSTVAEKITGGKVCLGIELGSTRIKAVLIDDTFAPIAQGNHEWENRLEEGIWTYHMEDVWEGIQDAYRDLKEDVAKKYGTSLRSISSIGISAMMHGYLAFDHDGNLLAPFRTWRNTITGEAAAELTEMFNFNIPLRWSIAHLEQSVLDGAEHISKVAFITTLAGYVHWKLTGKKVIGVGDASGMFPVDSTLNEYDAVMIQKYNAHLKEKGITWTIGEILPRLLLAGEDAGCLTTEGARLLDPTGELASATPVCPPEGDAGTGMVATNSVAQRTGNISAGTSVFSMVVLEKALSRVYPEIDMVTTPSGHPVAMVHCNNCTSDINAWVNMLQGFAAAAGKPVSRGEIYTALFQSAMKGEADCGGVMNVNYLSGEPITGMEEGRPMVLRTPDASLSFENFARSLVYGAVVTLKIGMDILAGEQVKIDSMTGHGGYFKTPGTAQKLLAGAIKAPVSVMETAGEGGPWGMALLAAFRVMKKPGETLEDFLSGRVFAGSKCLTEMPDEKDAAGFDAFTARFVKALPAQKASLAMK